MDEGPIPKMVHPLGKYWPQPNRNHIRVTDDRAYMSQTVLDKLIEYSPSIPTGKYPGKMWRSKSSAGLDIDLKEELGQDPVFESEWLLCWFGTDLEGCLTLNWRQVIVT